MSAVATKPRKSAPKLPGVSAPATYKRPESTYRPAIGKTAAERLEVLRAAFHAADAKIEAAYDAVETGTAVETLLDHINHELSMSVMSPILRNEDEANLPVTKADAEASYNAAFGMLAALEGAMALSIDDVIYPTLVEAFQLLDWAQTECDSCALGALLPALSTEQSTGRTRTGELDSGERIAEAVAVLHAAAHEHGRAEVWGVHTLAKLIESTLDSANPEDADDLQDVSNLLEQVLAVIDKVNGDALDCMLLHAGASLLTTAKQLVDDKCEAVS